MNRFVSSGEHAPVLVGAIILATMLALTAFLEIQFVAIAVAAIVALIVSLDSRLRLFMLVGLLPFVHAGLGIKNFQGFGIYDLFSAWFLLLFMARIVLVDLLHVDKPFVLKCGMAMVVAFLPSVVNTTSSFETTKAFIQLLVCVLTAAGAYFIVAEEGDRHMTSGVLRFLCLVAGVVSVVGIYQTSQTSSILSVVSGRVSTSFFTEVNYYACYLLMALALSLGYLVTERRLVAKIVFAAVSVTLVLGVAATVSRSGILVLIILTLAYAIYFFFQKGAQRAIGLVMLLGFMAIVGVLVTTDLGKNVIDLFTLSRRLETAVSGGDSSVEQRGAIALVAGRMILAHPLVGVGFGSFEATFDEYQAANLMTGNARAAHNTPLRLLAETGILGFVAGIMFVASLVTLLGSAYTRSRRGSDRTFMFSIIASLGTFALMSLTLDQLFEPHFWVVAGVAIAYAQKVVRGEVRTWQGEVQEGG